MNHATKLALRTLAAGVLGALALQAPVQAALCTVTNAGNPILTTVNPKPFVEPPPSTCLVNGLPGVGSDLPGYIRVAARSAPITVNGVTVGTLYDRVYCLGTGTTCNSTRTYILATRLRMLPTPVNFPARNPNCPMWISTSNECFEINDIFRNIRGTNAAPVAAEVGYWMGGTGTTADTAPAIKYLEFTGKTYQGLNQTITRNNTKIAFRTDANVSDPDGIDAPWSPWLMVKQNCPGGVVTTNLSTDARTRFAIKYRQGGEEGQLPTTVQAAAYVCVP